MKKRITFKMWLSVFFGGIWQFIRNIFSWKNKTPFWRVVWATITVCILIATVTSCYEFYERQKLFGHYNYLENYDPQLSENYKFRNNGRNSGKSYIYESGTKRKVMKGLDWIALPEDGDSLIVVAKDGKRGFVNRFTAETVLPFKYDAAWSFNDGVGAVCEGDSVYFIDHSGQPINNKKYLYRKGFGNYTYHGDCAAIPYGDKYGLVDRTGEWVVLPEYSDIHVGAKNRWYVMNDGKWGVIGPDGQFLLPIKYENVWIHGLHGITVADATDHSQSLYDFDGNLLEKFIFDEVSEMDYYIDEFDDEGNQKRGIDNMLKYSSNHYYGLMTRTGKPVTPPLYFNIECVAPGVYQCQLSGYMTDCIMINSNGEKIND